MERDEKMKSTKCTSSLTDGTSIFCKFISDKNQVGLAEVKNVFASYLDIQISDADILEFI